MALTTFPTAQLDNCCGSNDSVLISHCDLSSFKTNQPEPEKPPTTPQPMQNCVITADPDGRIEWVNNAFITQTGWTAAEVLGKKLSDLWQGELTDAKTICLINKKLRQRESFATEIINYHKNGSHYWTSLQIEPVFDENNQIKQFLIIQKEITVSKNLEIARNQNDERVRQALESTSDSWWDWNLITKEFQSSPHLFEVVGLPRNSSPISGEEWNLRKHPQDRVTSEELIAEHLAGKTPNLNYHYRVRHEQGHWIWLENQAKIIERDDYGRPSRMIGITRDVTEQYEAQEKMRRNENLLRQTAQMALIGGWEFDVFSKKLYCSDEISLIYKIPLEILPTVKTLINFYQPEERQIAAQSLRDAIEKGESFDFTGKIVSGEGSVRWTRVIGESFIVDGKCAKVYGTVQDITKQIQAELALRERHERFQVLADNLPVMVWQANADGTCTYVNKQWLEFSGKTIETHFGRGWLESVHPEDRQYLEDQFKNALKNKISYTAQYRVLNWEGVYRVVLDTGTPVFNEDRDFTCYLGSLFDVTERIELEELLQQSQKMEAMGQLAGGVAHDFNNLLTVILNYAEFLERKLTDEKLIHYAQRIRSASERAAALTNQLLAFSRKQMLQPKASNLNLIVEETLTFVERLISENITIQTKLADNLGVIYADRTQLEQVIINLAVNARDSMANGGKLIFETAAATTAEIETLTVNAENKRFVCLRVTDNGTGMDAEVLKRIFEPFFTTKEVGKGTGLGLATVHGIIKQSKGFIKVDSQAGRGTTFSVFLPCLIESLEIETQIKSKQLVGSGGGTLLVVDDEDGVREIVVQYLSDCGYRVLFAKNGVEALRLYHREIAQIDLLISDIVMPEMGGELLAKKFLEINPRLKIIFMSGFTQTEINLSSHQNSEIAFLKKPFDLSQMGVMIEEMKAVRKS